MMSESTASHRSEAGARKAVNCAVLTVSDSRTEETDESGKLMRRLIEEAGHAVTSYKLMKNDEPAVREQVRAFLGQADVDAVLITGGTGLGSRDRTVEAVTPLFDKQMPGFGEIFRMVSFTDQVGTAAILSRAVAGGVNGKLVVSMPGSKAAVELALTRVLLPELRHVMRELKR
jgi:molybdenum cofactor biosynthesis protein B